SWQVSSVDCYRSWGTCFEALAIFEKGSLLVFRNNYSITGWSRDRVEAVDKYKCAETVLALDRRSKTVTSTRSSRNIKDCGGVENPPVLFHLVDHEKARRALESTR